MAALFLDNAEMNTLNAMLSNMENEFGTEYSFTPDYSEYSCKCSGPGQSCVWH